MTGPVTGCARAVQESFSWDAGSLSNRKAHTLVLFAGPVYFPTMTNEHQRKQSEAVFEAAATHFGIVSPCVVVVVEWGAWEYGNDKNIR